MNTETKYMNPDSPIEGAGVTLLQTESDQDKQLRIVRAYREAQRRQNQFDRFIRSYSAWQIISD